MSYEKGDKFVLEIAEVMEGKQGNFYRAKNFASLVFDENGLQRLRRIRETAEEAYKRGYEDGKREAESGSVEYRFVGSSAEQLAKARAEGAEEAWSFRNKIIFDKKSDEFKWYDTAVKSFSESTYAETKAAFEKWKAAQKWEPKVGIYVIHSLISHTADAIYEVCR